MLPIYFSDYERHSQPDRTDFELAKRLHINELTKHENIQNSVGKLRGLPTF